MENFILKSNFFDQSVVRLPKRTIEAKDYSGSNQKKILIVSLVQAEGETTDDVFLKKIFESVKVDLAQDTCLFSFVQSKAFNWKTINSSFEFDQLVFFGRNLQNLGLQIAAQAYVPFNFQEKQILVAEPLNVIATDRAKKGALWNALKGMFLS